MRNIWSKYLLGKRRFRHLIHNTAWKTWAWKINVSQALYINMEENILRLGNFFASFQWSESVR